MLKQILFSHHSVEKVSGSSITEVSESLDIASMLQRAGTGILDLTNYRTFDPVYDTPEELESDELIPTFGMSREEAVDLYERSVSTVEQELAKAKGKMKTQDQPGGAAPSAEPSEE